MIVILGAGITGLAAGYFLSEKGRKYIILEKEHTVGGLCRSIYSRGFTFDYTGHCIHLSSPWAKRFVFEKFKKNSVEIKEHKRQSYIYLFRRYIPYPIQAHLWWLPKKVKEQVIKEIFITRCQRNPDKDKNKKFSFWAQNIFGNTLYKHFFYPYNVKVWNYDLDKLSSEWTEKFVPQPSFEEFIMGYVSKENKDFGYNTIFYYPFRGGVNMLVNSIAKDVKDIRCNIDIEKIDWQKKVVYFKNNELKYEKLINTIPLPQLLFLLVNLPTKIKNVINKLVWSSVYCINIGARKMFYKKMHWFYVPEKKYKFYRVGFYNNLSSYNVPSNDYMGMYIELAVNGRDKIVDIKKLEQKIILQLIDMKIIKNRNDIEIVNTLYIPYGYVVYNTGRERVLPIVLKFLSDNGIYSIGRYGAWKYSYIEENIIDARNLVYSL